MRLSSVSFGDRTIFLLLLVGWQQECLEVEHQLKTCPLSYQDPPDWDVQLVKSIKYLQSN